jgi:hypothetical protein
MTNWKYKVKIKHLFTKKEDIDSIQESMNKIADILVKEPCFGNFLGIKNFRNIPKGDDVITPVDYANKLIEKIYNYADEKLIWIE